MIKIENVCYKYAAHEEKYSLNKMNLSIKKGEFVVLCGRSGCGKSTISRLINGLIPHFYDGELSGEVIVGGMNTKEVSLPRISKIVGSVFQNPKSQFFNIDTTSELAFGCENQGLAREETLKRVKLSAENLDLEKLLNRNIFELSGGEKQRVACGSVYATLPDVFVLDEPSSNLDAVSMLKLKNIMGRLKQEGKTVVISEHRLHYLTGLADRYIYVQDGEIEKEFSATAFNALSFNELNKLGLRTTKLSELEAKGNMGDLPNEAAVRVLNMTYSYQKENPTLSVADIEFKKGSVVAVIGKNGAGKSTFLNSLCGIFKAKGTVLIDGEECSHKKRVARSFMVMQDVNYQLFCEDVDTEVKLKLSEEDGKAVPALLERLELLHLADNHPVSLSGGEKQRVAICCALAAKKQILLYDEPTSGLDFSGMNEFSKLVLENRKKVLISFIVTHDIELVLNCASHILHMENGRVKDFYALDNRGERKLKEFAMC